MIDNPRQTYRRYGFLTDRPLNRRQLDRLIACFQRPSEATAARLVGRCQMPTLTLDPLGPVVVKCYRRGGWLGRFNRRHYLNLNGGATRSESEYTWLNRARDLGLNAPKPLVAAHQGTWVYRCWLVTREVVGATSLAQLSVERPAGIDKMCSACARQIDILVENRILHPDLHPGNVLVDPDGQSWLIDFDKTRHYRGRRQRLKEHYRRRWTRAVLKYGLPPALGAVIQQSRNGWQA